MGQQQAAAQIGMIEGFHMISQAILLLTHLAAPRHCHEFNRIHENLSSFTDIFTLFHCNDGIKPDFPGQVYPFTTPDMQQLGFPMFRDTLVPGSTHFPVMAFARQRPGYDYYWVIEYDVWFRGDWNVLPGHCSSSKADLLTCHIRSYEDEPKWWWWGLNHPRHHIPLTRRYRSFNPVYRISGPALRYVDQMHRTDWSGHYEELLPTLLFHGGYRLQDFGGTGQFVNPQDRNRFYIDSTCDRKGRMKTGTMRFRPVFTKPGWRKNKLYHPVKISDNGKRIPFLPF